MAQIVIKIPDEIYDWIKNGFLDEKDGEKATNGDVIKAMFPQDEEIILDTIIFKLNGSKCRVSVDWWNTPYTKEQNSIVIKLIEAVTKGKIIPNGHDELIERSETIKSLFDYHSGKKSIGQCIDDVLTVIEADEGAE